MRKLLPLLALTMLGCGTVTPSPTADPLDVDGVVTKGGKPLSGVVLNLQPTGEGLPAVIPLTDGKFKTQVIPGKYTYYITAGTDQAAFDAIPKEFREPSLDREEIQVDESTSSIDIELE